MKRVLLATLNARYTHSCLALYYLKSCLQESGVEAEIREFNINQPLLEILHDIAELQPDIIGFSVYIWNSNQMKQLLPDLLKVLPQVRIILGGPEVSYNAEKWLDEFDCIDHIVCGAGESVFTELALHGSNEKIIHSTGRKLSTIPFPYDGLEIEGKDNRYFYYESSRGCPYRCSYCLSSRCDQVLDFRSEEQVFAELDWFMHNDFRHIKFVDRTFNADVRRARAIWNYLKERLLSDANIKTDFHFEVHPQLLSEEDFSLLADVPADRFRFEIGIQSLHAPTLQAIGRDMNWQKVRDNLLRLQEMGNIELHVDLIAGLPLEDFDTFGKGFEEVFALLPGQLQLGFLKVLPGTQMAEEAEKYGITFQENAPYQVLSTAVMSFAEMNRMSLIENLLEIYYNSGRFSEFCRQVVRKRDSAWGFFNGLVGWFLAEKADLQTRKWEKCAELLASFCEKMLPVKREFMLDCLRLDYCLQSRGHNYPDFLQHERLADARRIGIDYLQRLKKEELGEITTGEVKSAICFLPASREFPEQDVVQIFIGRPGKKRKLFSIPG